MNIELGNIDTRRIDEASRPERPWATSQRAPEAHRLSNPVHSNERVTDIGAFPESGAGYIHPTTIRAFSAHGSEY